MYRPQEIIKNILFRLPTESLIRLRAVCKQWKATISNPKFIQTHLRRSNNNTSFSCLVGDQPFTRIHLEYNEFRPIQAWNNPSLSSSRNTMHCHCDGLYLVASERDLEKKRYILWNSSLRRRTWLHYPYPLDPEPNRIFGICYNPSIQDYLVVIGDAKHYAVFFCRDGTWSEENETNIHADRDMPYSDGIPFDGSIYWVFLRRSGGSRLVRFDGRDGKMKNVASRVDDPGCHYACMISSWDSLYVFIDSD